MSIVPIIGNLWSPGRTDHQGRDPVGVTIQATPPVIVRVSPAEGLAKCRGNFTNTVAGENEKYVFRLCNLLQNWRPWQLYFKLINYTFLPFFLPPYRNDIDGGLHFNRGPRWELKSSFKNTSADDTLCFSRAESLNVSSRTQQQQTNEGGNK